MDFAEQLKLLIDKIIKYKDQINTEEATKTAFIMPFFDLLGYDTRNPIEFIPEFTCDIGTKKGKKIDYAIHIDNQPTILIECKWCGENLEKHDAQLMRYFSVSQAKIGILTNGIIYKFFTDLEETNKMDSKPFLEINLLSIRDNEIVELKKFFRSNFDINSILSTAEELKYSNSIKKVFISQLDSPDENFVTYFLNEVYDGKKTAQAKEKFKGLVKKSISEVMNDIVRNRIENALTQKETVQEQSVNTQEEPIKSEPTLDTTQEELEAYFIVKSILSEITQGKRITYKDTTRYFNVLLDDNTRKWICRLYANSQQKYIAFPLADKQEEKLPIDSIENIYNFKDRIKEIFTNIEG